MEVSEHSDLQECNKAQISEMERFKWFMGEQIGHDPLRDRSINEIYEEWIGKYGAAFRAWWEEQKREKRKQYNGSACALAGGDKIKKGIIYLIPSTQFGSIIKHQISLKSGKYWVF
jgi:hypothetical protein